jgi:hypothetical protein
VVRAPISITFNARVAFAYRPRLIEADVCRGDDIRLAKSPWALATRNAILESRRPSGGSVLSSRLDFRKDTRLHVENKAPYRDILCNPRM